MIGMCEKEQERRKRRRTKKEQIKSKERVRKEKRKGKQREERGDQTQLGQIGVAIGKQIIKEFNVLIYNQIEVSITFMNNFQSLRVIQLSMSDTSDFEEGDFEVCGEQIDQELPSVKKYLWEAKDIMDKILFSSYKINNMFPIPFVSIPDVVKPDTAQHDSNNMNLIEQSSFRHEKLKRDIIGFLLNSNLPSKASTRKNLPSIFDYYERRNPCYEKYQSNPSSKSMATYIMDTKSLLKQDLKRNSKLDPTQNRASNCNATHRTRIQFNSNFESGNLFRVYQKQYNEYDLILQNDINTKGNNQWFSFSVKNAPKNMTIKFNIVNLTKKHSLFDQGMKPYTFSLGRFEKRKVGWVRQGMKVNYQENQLFSKETSQKPYYKLSFEYKFPYEGDIVYFAQSIPYGVSDLSKFLATHVNDKLNKKILRFKNIARTLGNQEVDVIEISDEESRENRQVVWIIGRQHSGEVTSSFMMEGIINTLLSKTDEANFLLKNYIFRIVPMVNVDGVVHGNSRAELSGADPNRKWANPHKLRNPVIWALKKMIEKDKGNIAMFLDLHSHSRKLGTFFYGNSLRDSKMSTRKFPMMVSIKDERFSYTSCRFSPCNNSSARHVLFESFKIPLIYTVESSLFGYQKNDHKIVEYLPKDYREMGKTLVDSFYQMNKSKMKLALEMNVTSVIDNEQEEEFEMERKKEEQLDANAASDSDPSGDEYEDSELKAFLPNLYGKKKEKEKKDKKNKKKKGRKEEKQQKEETVTPIRAKKNDKQSSYRIYFSGRHSALGNRQLKEIKTVKETKEIGIQVCVAESRILKGSMNISSKNLMEKRNSLCILGQKVEEEVTISGNYIGIQADMGKLFTQPRDEVRNPLSRKSFKVSNRPNSILQVKENNFLNRADCHTMPLRSLGRR